MNIILKGGTGLEPSGSGGDVELRGDKLLTLGDVEAKIKEITEGPEGAIKDKTVREIFAMLLDSLK